MIVAIFALAVVAACDGRPAAPPVYPTREPRAVFIESPDVAYLAMPNGVDDAVAFLKTADETVSAPVADLLRRETRRAFTAERLAAFFRASPAVERIDPSVERAFDVAAKDFQAAESAATVDLGGSRRRADPATPRIAQLAGELPNARVAVETGMTAFRALYMLTGISKGYPKALAERVAKPDLLAAAAAEFVRVTRADGEANDSYFPAAQRAKSSAIEHNVKILDTLSAQDVGALKAFYESAAGRARADAAVAAFRRANDAAAVEVYKGFYLGVVKLVPLR